jgi:pimeloyl-ACP methyl ester carboxylesterase
MIVLLVLLLVVAAGRAAQWRLARTHPAPGELVDVGGYRLHIQRSGVGPTVVLDAGAGGTSYDWALVRKGVDRFATTIAYDRAGLGRSELGTKPRSVQKEVTDLRAALRASGLHPPYVLVGHSYGGLVVRAYAYEHTEEVSGLVLVDAAHEDQFDHYPKEYVDSGRRMGRAMRRMAWITGAAVGSGIPAFFAGRIPDVVADALPPDVGADRRATTVMSSKHLRTVTDEFAALEDSFSYVRQIRRPLGDLPVIVITHGVPVTAGVPEHLRSAVEKAWQEMQSDLTSISTSASLVVAERSGHNIHVEQPDIIVDAIFSVLNSRRRAHGALTS